MKVRTIFEKVRVEGRKNLTEVEAREVLRAYDIPVVDGKVVKSFEEAYVFAKHSGYPLVLKVVSPDIVHKTDVGGVALNIRSDKELKDRYYSLIRDTKDRAKGAQIDGVFVQKMMEGGYEVIIGGKHDQTFGQTILFGLGGIFVEVYDDVSFRIVPITRKDAREMIEEVKAYKILKGYRGKKSADLSALINILLKTSKMLEENQEIKELDINPVFALPDMAVAVDARVVIG